MADAMIAHMISKPQHPARHILSAMAEFTGLLLVVWTLGWQGCALRASADQAGRGAPPARSEAQGPGISTRQLNAALRDALAKGEKEKAREIVARMLRLPRLDSDLLLRVGIELAEQELYKEASQTFARCVKDHPQAFECRYDLALAYSALGMNTEALVAAEGLHPVSGEEQVAKLYLRGKIQALLGKDLEAEKDLSAAFSRAPDQVNGALDLGLLYLRQHNYAKAADVFARGATHHQDSSFLRLGLALAQLLGGGEAEAIKTCQTLLAQQPDLSPARVLLAFTLYIQGKLPEAVQIAAAGFNFPRPVPYLYYLHATLLLKLDSKQYDQIDQDLRLALRDMPTCTLCYVALSKIHQRRGELDLATAELEKTVSLDPSFAEAWYRLASVYERAGRPADAVRARQRFDQLKQDKLDRETDMLKEEFLRTFGEGPAKSP